MTRVMNCSYDLTAFFTSPMCGKRTSLELQQQHQREDVKRFRLQTAKRKHEEEEREEEEEHVPAPATLSVASKKKRLALSSLKPNKTTTVDAETTTVVETLLLQDRRLNVSPVRSESEKEFRSRYKFSRRNGSRDEIAKGAYGVVYSATATYDDSLSVVVKVCEKKSLTGSETFRVLSEIDILWRLAEEVPELCGTGSISNDNDDDQRQRRKGVAQCRFVRLIEYCDAQDRFYIATERAPGMELYSFYNLHHRSGMPEFCMRPILKALFSGVRVLHEQLEIAHLDLKLENLMWDPSTDTMTLLDFGFASPTTVGSFVKTYLRRHRSSSSNSSSNAQFPSSVPSSCVSAMQDDVNSAVYILLRRHTDQEHILDLMGEVERCHLQHDRHASKTRLFLRETCGSRHYASPEMYKGGFCRTSNMINTTTTTNQNTLPLSASDVWSLGVLTYVLRLGVFPFDDDQQYTKHSSHRLSPSTIKKRNAALQNKILTSTIDMPHSISTKLAKMLRNMLHRSVNTRATLRQLVESTEWFTNYL